MRKGFCHHCGDALEFDEKVFRNDVCARCGSDVYCCLNCSEYDESYADHCKEPQADREAVKDRRNFCDFFSLRQGKGASDGAARAAKSRAKLEALFKK